MPCESDYQRIEGEIASDTSPVGIDAKKTHVLILAKLESIERRLDTLEGGGGVPRAVRGAAENALAAATDTFDESVRRLRDRGVDVDERAVRALGLVEKLTEPKVLEALERLTELATLGPGVLAGFTDAFDEEVARASDRGVEIDAAMRNGIAAILYLGQRISTKELESLGTLLRSEVLHPNAVDVIGRMGCALVAATQAPSGSVGPIGAFGKLGDKDARRSTAFLLEFARQFGAALDGKGRSCTQPINGGHTNG